MQVPNADRAVVELSKLRDYCLNPEHPRGRHNARVFQSALGLSIADAESLPETLLLAVRGDNADVGERDVYGQRYTVDVVMSGRSGSTIVRSTWIVRINEDFPRLTSCYVL